MKQSEIAEWLKGLGADWYKALSVASYLIYHKDAYDLPQGEVKVLAYHEAKKRGILPVIDPEPDPEDPEEEAERFLTRLKSELLGRRKKDSLLLKNMERLLNEIFNKGYYKAGKSYKQELDNLIKAFGSKAELEGWIEEMYRPSDGSDWSYRESTGRIKVGEWLNDIELMVDALGLTVGSLVNWNSVKHYYR